MPTGGAAVFGSARSAEAGAAVAATAAAGGGGGGGAGQHTGDSGVRGCCRGDAPSQPLTFPLPGERAAGAGATGGGAFFCFFLFR